MVVTPANKQERAQVAELAEQIQAATGDTVEIAFIGQGYASEQVAEGAAQHGMCPEVVKLSAAS